MLDGGPGHPVRGAELRQPTKPNLALRTQEVLLKGGHKGSKELAQRQWTLIGKAHLEGNRCPLAGRRFCVHPTQAAHTCVTKSNRPESYAELLSARARPCLLHPEKVPYKHLQELLDVVGLLQVQARRGVQPHAPLLRAARKAVQAGQAPCSWRGPPVSTPALPSAPISRGHIPPERGLLPKQPARAQRQARPASKDSTATPQALLLLLHVHRGRAKARIGEVRHAKRQACRRRGGRIGHAPGQQLLQQLAVLGRVAEGVALRRSATTCRQRSGTLLHERTFYSLQKRVWCQMNKYAPGSLRRG